MAKSNFSIKAIYPGVEEASEERYFGRSIHLVYIPRPYNDYRKPAVLIAGSVLFPTTQCYAIAGWLDGDGKGNATCNDIGSRSLNRFEQGYRCRIERDRWGRSQLTFIARTTGLCLDYDLWLYQTILRHTKTPVLPEWFDNPKFKAMIIKPALKLSSLDGRQKRAILYFDNWSADSVVQTALRQKVITCS